MIVAFLICRVSGWRGLDWLSTVINLINELLSFCLRSRISWIFCVLIFPKGWLGEVFRKEFMDLWI